jgi:shikimate dehydrogenase
MAQAISAHTALAGVLGDPVRHSLSPAMHNAALAGLGLDWVYLGLPTPASVLAGVVEAMGALNCRGLNVTIPHKQTVAALCSELSPLARRLGAVNTLVPLPAGGWLGTNTDVEGFLAPLRYGDAAPADGWRGRGAVVLGCGGSARAVVAGLVDLGCDPISVAGRRAEATAAFVAACAAWAPALKPLAWEHLAAALPEAALVVNTTPVGMAAAGAGEAAEDGFAPDIRAVRERNEQHVAPGLRRPFRLDGPCFPAPPGPDCLHRALRAPPPTGGAAAHSRADARARMRSGGPRAAASAAARARPSTLKGRPPRASR